MTSPVTWTIILPVVEGLNARFESSAAVDFAHLAPVASTGCLHPPRARCVNRPSPPCRHLDRPPPSATTARPSIAHSTHALRVAWRNTADRGEVRIDPRRSDLVIHPSPRLPWGFSEIVTRLSDACRV